MGGGGAAGALKLPRRAVNLIEGRDSPDSEGESNPDEFRKVKLLGNAVRNLKSPVFQIRDVDGRGKPVPVVVRSSLDPEANGVFNKILTVKSLAPIFLEGRRCPKGTSVNFPFLKAVLCGNTIEIRDEYMAEEGPVCRLLNPKGSIEEIAKSLNLCGQQDLSWDNRRND